MDSDTVTVGLELLLGVFVTRFWLPVVNLGSHFSLECNPKQREPQRVFHWLLTSDFSMKSARFCLLFWDQPTPTAIPSTVTSKVPSFSSVSPFYFFLVANS